MIIHDDGQSQVLAADRSFQNFLTPHQVTYAKLGIFLHAYADRVSHHMCTDRSWFQRQISGNYDSNYDQVYCAQGSHFSGTPGSREPINTMPIWRRSSRPCDQQSRR